MHGLGNDFVVIDTISQSFSTEKFPVQTLSDRHRGIGFDQLLLVGKSKNADFSCRIYNSDGTEAEQCGNGMRCIARFIFDEKLSEKTNFTIETKGGLVEVDLKDYENITVNMGIPQFQPNCDILLPKNQALTLFLVSIGNPHALLPVESVDQFPVRELGQQIATHANFPKGINVGFMEVINRDKIRLRTFERGVGETFACGTNSCAAVVAGINNGFLNKEVAVELAFGSLFVSWAGHGESITMRGPAQKVFEGQIALEDLFFADKNF